MPYRYSIVTSNLWRFYHTSYLPLVVPPTSLPNIFLRFSDSQRFCHLSHHLRSLHQLLLLVPRAHNRPNPCFSLSHRRVSHRGSEYPRIEQPSREFKRLGCFPDMNWYDRCLACLELESAFFQLALESFCIFPKFLDQLLARWRIQNRKRRHACRGRRRRVRCGKQEWPCPQVKKIDQVPRATNIPAHRPHCFAQRPHLDVHTSMAIKVVHRAAPVAAHY